MDTIKELGPSLINKRVVRHGEDETGPVYLVKGVECDRPINQDGAVVETAHLYKLVNGKHVNNVDVEELRLSRKEDACLVENCGKPVGLTNGMAHKMDLCLDHHEEKIRANA